MDFWEKEGGRVNLDSNPKSELSMRSLNGWWWGGGGGLSWWEDPDPNQNFSPDFPPSLTSSPLFWDKYQIFGRNCLLQVQCFASQIISVWRLMNWGTIRQLQSWSVEAGYSLYFNTQISLCNEPKPFFSGWLLSLKTFSRICLTKEVKNLLNCPEVSCSCWFLINATTSFLSG